MARQRMTPLYARRCHRAVQATPTMQTSQHHKDPAMSLSLILLIVLILILIGALPTWGHSRSWGYGPSGGIGLVVLILVVLLLMGRI